MDAGSLISNGKFYDSAFICIPFSTITLIGFNVNISANTKQWIDYTVTIAIALELIAIAIIYSITLVDKFIIINNEYCSIHDAGWAIP